MISMNLLLVKMTTYQLIVKRKMEVACIGATKPKRKATKNPNQKQKRRKMITTMVDSPIQVAATQIIRHISVPILIPWCMLPREKLALTKVIVGLDRMVSRAFLMEQSTNVRLNYYISYHSRKSDSAWKSVQ